MLRSAPQRPCPPRLRVGKRRQSGEKFRFCGIGKAVDLRQKHTAETIVLTAQERQAGGHCLDIGQSLRFAAGCADENIADLVIVRYTLRRGHTGEDHAPRDAQLPHLRFQLLAVRPVAHQQKPDVLGRVRQKAQQLADAFFLRQTANIGERKVALPQPQRTAQDGPLFRRKRREKRTHFQTRRNGADRLRDLIGAKHIPDLFRWDDHGVGLTCDVVRKLSRQKMPQPDIGREVVRKVLVYRVVGVDQRTAALMSDALGKGEGGELALAVNDVRLPVDQLLHERIVQPCPKTRIGVDHADADRANKSHIFFPVRVQIVGQRQDSDIMPRPAQPLLQIGHGGDDPVNDWLVSVGSDQNLHSNLLPAPLSGANIFSAETSRRLECTENRSPCRALPCNTICAAARIPNTEFVPDVQLPASFRISGAAPLHRHSAPTKFLSRSCCEAQ